MQAVWSMLLCAAFTLACAPAQQAGGVEAERADGEARALGRAALHAVVGHHVCTARAPCSVLKIDPVIRRTRYTGLPDTTTEGVGRLELSEVAALPTPRVVLEAVGRS